MLNNWEIHSVEPPIKDISHINDNLPKNDTIATVRIQFKIPTRRGHWVQVPLCQFSHSLKKATFFWNSSTDNMPEIFLVKWPGIPHQSVNVLLLIQISIVRQKHSSDWLFFLKLCTDRTWQCVIPYTITLQEDDSVFLTPSSSPYSDGKHTLHGHCTMIS